MVEKTQHDYDFLQATETILKAVLCREPLTIPLRQRARFEGWLKLELAYGLEEHGFTVELEHEVEDYRPDIRADLNGTAFLLMLKTINMNFRFSDIRPTNVNNYADGSGNS
jgi:hypothetical protein